MSIDSFMTKSNLAHLKHVKSISEHLKVLKTLPTNKVKCITQHVTIHKFIIQIINKTNSPLPTN